MEDVLKGLHQAEYLHVIFNHLPVVGLAAGLLVLLCAIFQKSRSTAVAAYGVILLMSLSIVPVMKFGIQAQDQVESLLDEPGRSWLQEHESRADKVAWFFHATSALALAGLILPRYSQGISHPLLWATLVMGTVAMCGGAWTATAGGKIMHHEFRYSPPPASDRQETVGQKKTAERNPLENENNRQRLTRSPLLNYISSS